MTDISLQMTNNMMVLHFDKTKLIYVNMSNFSLKASYMIHLSYDTKNLMVVNGSRIYFNLKVTDGVIGLNKAFIAS